MAKIDVTKIPGYDTMSDADKVKALQDFDFQTEASGDELTKLKNQLSKANAEAAENKRKLQERMTAEEKEKEAREEEAKKVQEELDTLRKEKRVVEFEKEYTKIGYSAEQAAKAAKAKVDGDVTTEFAVQAEFQAAQKKAFEEAALNGNSKLGAGSPPKSEAEKKEYEQMLQAARGW